MWGVIRLSLGAERGRGEELGLDEEGGGALGLGYSAHLGIGSIGDTSRARIQVYYTTSPLR